MDPSSFLEDEGLIRNSFRFGCTYRVLFIACEYVEMYIRMIDSYFIGVSFLFFPFLMHMLMHFVNAIKTRIVPPMYEYPYNYLYLPLCK